MTKAKTLASLKGAAGEVQGVPVYGVSAKGLANLLAKFPQLLDLFKGDRDNAVLVESLVDVAPDAVAAIIAAGTGHPGDADEEEAAASLPLETQADFLAEIARLTLPNGLQAFVDKLGRLSGLASGAPSGPAPTVPAQAAGGAPELV